jgi:hypothetical protein
MKIRIPRPHSPGRWFHHHNLYHLVEGMANVAAYSS